MPKFLDEIDLLSMPNVLLKGCMWRLNKEIALNMSSWECCVIVLQWEIAYILSNVQMGMI